jgi:hypothetical protein
MRRFLIGLVVAATTALLPALVLAGNQEIAESIAKSLRDSGKLYDYKIGVKFQDGTVWLKGQVCSEEQLRIAMNLAAKLDGVQRVNNELSVAPAMASGQGGADNTVTMNIPLQEPQSRKATPAAPAPTMMAQAKPAPEAPAAPIPATAVSAPVPTAAQPVATSFAPRPAQAVAATEEETEAPQLTEPQPIRHLPRTRMVAQPMATQPSATYAQPSEPVGDAVTTSQATRGPVAANGAPCPVGPPMPCYNNMGGGMPAAARYNQAYMPNYAWPSYAAYPNYAAVTYPKQYSPATWPYIGPFYPYPQVPLGWRKVTLEWDSGWWMLDFHDCVH